MIYHFTKLDCGSVVYIDLLSLVELSKNNIIYIEVNDHLLLSQLRFAKVRTHSQGVFQPIYIEIIRIYVFYHLYILPI